MNKSKKNKTKKGFTLLEIIVVLIIVGAAAALAYPRLITAIEKVRTSKGEQILIEILASQKRFSLDNNGNYTNVLADLDWEQGSIASTDFAAPVILDGKTGPNFYVAEITRTGSYKLSIDINAQIYCTVDQVLCNKLGYQ